jgi:hypothetical protein
VFPEELGYLKALALFRFQFVYNWKAAPRGAQQVLPFAERTAKILQLSEISETLFCPSPNYSKDTFTDPMVQPAAVPYVVVYRIMYLGQNQCSIKNDEIQ